MLGMFCFSMIVTWGGCILTVFQNLLEFILPIHTFLDTWYKSGPTGLSSLLAHRFEWNRLPAILFGIRFKPLLTAKIIHLNELLTRNLRVFFKLLMFLIFVGDVKWPILFLKDHFVTHSLIPSSTLKKYNFYISRSLYVQTVCV